MAFGELLAGLLGGASRPSSSGRSGKRNPAAIKVAAPKKSSPFYGLSPSDDLVMAPKPAATNSQATLGVYSKPSTRPRTQILPIPMPGMMGADPSMMSGGGMPSSGMMPPPQMTAPPPMPPTGPPMGSPQMGPSGMPPPSGPPPTGLPSPVGGIQGPSGPPPPQMSPGGLGPSGPPMMPPRRRPGMM